MRLLIATPLYPPDIAPLAVYVKELARRLSAESTEVTVLAYGHIPEKIDNVQIIPVRKDRPLLLRLFAMTLVLWDAMRDADVILVANGASVELPASILSFFTRKPIVFMVADRVALTSAQRHRILRYIFRTLCSRATYIIHDTDMEIPCHTNQKCVALALPLRRPEILPFAPLPENTFVAYENSWKEYLTQLHSHIRI